MKPTQYQLAKTAFRNWQADYAPSMGAALAYYAEFSIAFLPVSVIAVAAMFDRRTGEGSCGQPEP